jgi:SAM-dependent methyltransferase
VTVLDNSPAQLGQDRHVAEREGLHLSTVEGDMRDLSHFGASAFDLVFHPISNPFIPDVRPVWAEAYRVLRRGGMLLAGCMNPDVYLFDRAAIAHGQLIVRHRLPYSDLESQTEDEREAQVAQGLPLEWSHTLTDLIGGQIEAGFALTGFYEDFSTYELLAQYAPTYFATRAVK